MFRRPPAGADTNGAGRSEEGRGLGRRSEVFRQSPDATATQAKVKHERTQPWVSRVRFKESRD